MNIIYMHTHDTGRYIQPYGYQIPTPNLMRLAQEGTLFRHAYCTAPTCSPSRASLLSGMAAHSCGMIGLAHRGFKMNDYGRHITRFLNAHGFETALCGVQHEAPRAEMIGYQKILHDSRSKAGSSVEIDVQNAQIAADYIKERKDKPFFLSFGMINTHREYPPIDESINPNYVIPPFPFIDNDNNRRDMAAFMTSAKAMDKCVGIVMDALKNSGLEDDTLMIFTTDHGIAFPMMKCNLYDTGIGVSLIMKYPGNPRKGDAIDALVSHIDIYPTLCDMLGMDKPTWLQGKSMLPLLEGRVNKIRDEVFAEVTYHAAYEPMRCIRTERYKYIKFFDDHDRFVPANIDDGLTKSFLIEHGYLEQTRDKEMLFDLYMDPVERVNLIGNSRYKEIYGDLAERLHRWMVQTDDPLLKGKVLKPEGAIANKITCLSPETQDFE